MKGYLLITTSLFTGLSAGLFLAWAISVIPGTRRVADLTYLETMQSINRAILNPAFYLIFFGSLLLLIISTIQEYQLGVGLRFGVILAATLSYLVGTFAVTVFGNVPLNEALDAVHLGSLGETGLANTRQQYEVKWNKLHMVRTVFSVLAFLLSLLTVSSSNRVIEAM